MKKAIALFLALLMLANVCAAIAEGGSEVSNTEIIAEAGDPNFDELTITEWQQYEFNKDYATVFSDITSFDHEYVRKLLDSHWQLYLALGIPPLRTATDEEAREMLIKHHNLRASATTTKDVEAQRIYLWPEGKVPTVTEYTENPGFAYADAPGFQPYMIEMLVEEGVQPKGAVIISAGGGHMYRSNVEEALKVALALNAEGYQCFILNYRVNPYTDNESAIDVARAVKIVRANAAKYGIEEDHIAAAGFSYGGIVTSLAADIYAGDTNASALVSDYQPDEIDAVSSDLNAYLAIYSVTPDVITNEKFPPSFFVYGSEDAMLWNWGFRTYELVKAKGIYAELHTMSGVPHGFGAGTDAQGIVYENASTWPMMADVFMTYVYAQEDLPVEQRSAVYTGAVYGE